MPIKGTAFVIIVLLSALPVNAQDYYSLQNRERFADFLFETGDYLRASLEYEAISYSVTEPRDTLLRKYSLALLKNGDYEKLATLLNGIKNTNFGVQTNLLKYKLYFLTGDEKILPPKNQDSLNPVFQRLIVLMRAGKVEEKSDREYFTAENRAFLQNYSDVALSGDAFSPFMAAALSTIVPGAGKVYIGRTGEGLTTLIITGLLVYSAIKNPTSRGITVGFAGWFYLSDIYGSFIGAKVKNRKLKTENEESFKNFLRENDFFMPEGTEDLPGGVKTR